MKTNIYIFLSYLAQILLEWEMLQEKVVERIETQISSLVTFLDNSAVYEIMWKSIVARGKPQMKIWRTRIACWIHKATNIHAQAV